jgi:hypothetical protein
MKFFLVLAPCVCSLLFFSCKKSDISLVVAGSSYYKSDITSSSAIRVYSSGGEITDPDTKNRFISADGFYFESGANPSNNGPGILNDILFADAQHAVVNENFQPYNCSIAVKDPLIILSRIDTSRGVTYGEVLTHHVTYYIGKIKPQVFDENISSSSANMYIFGFTGIEKFVAIQENNQLTTPFLQFIVHGINGSGINFGFYRVNNILQPDFYLHLPAGDTVVLREYRVSYKKQ